MGSRLTSRVSAAGLLLVLIQRAHTGPHPQRPRLSETGDQALAVIEHLLDLVAGDLPDLVGIGGMDVGGADHADTVRIGTRMSPSAGIVQRLITVFTSRWFMAIMIPLPGMTLMPSKPGHPRDPRRPTRRRR